MNERESSVHRPLREQQKRWNVPAGQRPERCRIVHRRQLLLLLGLSCLPPPWLIGCHMLKRLVIGGHLEEDEDDRATHMFRPERREATTEGATIHSKHK